MKKSKVMKALLVFGMSMVTATAIVGITACDDGHTHVDENKDGKCDICSTDMPKEDGGGENLKVDVEKVELNKSNLTLEIGGEETLQATVTPSTATNKTVTWSAEPAGIVSVTNGKVKALAAGDAVVTATADGKKATCKVKVNAPAPKPEVTEDEWKEALSETSFTNFAARLTMSDDTENGLELKADLEHNKYRYTDNTGTDYYYAKESDDNYYKYEKGAADEDYTKTETTQSDYEGQLSSLEHMCVLLFKDSFASVTYDSENNAYVGESVDIGDGNTYNIIFKFDHGKLVYADIDFGEEARMILEYSQYGGIAITLPTIGGEQPVVGEEVTAEQWAELLGGVSNSTVTGESENTVCMTVKTDGTKIYISMSDESIFVKDGDNYSKYLKNGTTWSKQDITAEQYAAGIAECAAYRDIIKTLSTEFSSFTYADGKYTGTGFNRMSGGQSITLENVVLTFADGALTDAEYEVDGMKFVFSDIGSTTIDLPPVGGGDEQEVPEITEWTAVGDPIYGEVHENNTDYIYHHIYFNDIDAKAYDFDSYEATVKVDGAEGVIVTTEPMSSGEIEAHTYHLRIRIEANKYQTAEFTINFKKDGKTVATGTYTRVGDKEVVLEDEKYTISKDATEPTSVSILSINGKTDFTGFNISWSIADTEGTGVASIPEDSHGSSVAVTALAEGKATLTCTIGEGADAFSTTCVITVVAGTVEEEKPLDVSDKLVQQEVYGQWNIAIRLDCDTDLGGKITGVDVTATMDGEPVNVAIHEVYGNGPKYVKMGVSQDWSHDYVFTLNYKNAAGKVIATGTFNKSAPKSLNIDKPIINLTLKEGETVTDTLTATTKKIEGEISWSIDDENVATITVEEDGTVTVTAVAKGSATITASADGITKTCKVNVLEEGEEVTAKQLTATSDFEYGNHYMRFILNEDMGAKGGDLFDDVHVNGAQQSGGWIERLGPWNGGGYAYNLYVGELGLSSYHVEFLKGGEVVAEFTYSA